ncbi:UbiA family prenyltransferase [Candidatus Woesearchaeota archaeon]|nr:UbiA family prenyltransferase [Candidatus Woesearchaeota archaeon]
MGLWNLFRLVRPYQWYKNLIVALALIFSGNLFNTNLLIITGLAFASFSLLSSASYVLNDLADKERDKRNPEKKGRPLASGKVGDSAALLLVVLLCMGGFGISLFLPVSFTYVALAFFSLSQIYTIWLKHEPFADILAIACNFVLRAAAGAFAIGVWISPWLVANVFFLGLFIALGKRKGEVLELGDDALVHRPVLAYYDSPITLKIGSIITSALLIAYTLFVFFGNHSSMFITLPVVLYAVFRYEYLVESGSAVARHPHKGFADIKLMFPVLLWCIMVFMILY